MMMTRIPILKQLLFLLLAVGLAVGAEQAPDPKANSPALYQNNFEQAEAGKVPEDFMVLEGAWTVKQESGNKFLELPGAPLDTFGLLFGPSETADVAASARIYGTSRGRRAPILGLGLNGVGGYKLQVAPGRRTLELHSGDQIVKTTPFQWQTNSWTILKLQIRKTGDRAWAVEGKAWPQAAPEPAWLISVTATNAPMAGKASIWGAPVSGTPLRFDDLQVQRVPSAQK